MAAKKKSKTDKISLVRSIDTYNPNLASLVLRVGLAFVFVYAGISGLRTPDAWIGYIPSFTTHVMSAKTALDIASVLQLILAVVLVTGRYLKYAAALSAVLLIGIVFTNWAGLIITFRDIGLAAAAVALIFLD